MKEMSARKKGYLTRKVRLLQKLRGIEGPLSVQEETFQAGISENRFYNYRKEIESAILEAARKKAEAISWQRRHVIC